LLGAITATLSGFQITRPFARKVYNEAEVVELGATRPPFSGTDTLSLSVQPKVLEWAKLPDYPDIVGEGDRLANSKFFTAMRDLGYDLNIVNCYAPEHVVAERRSRRILDHQLTEQDPTWIRGRNTKVEALVASWATADLNMNKPLAEIVAEAVKIPVLDALWEVHYDRDTSTQPT
jgi:hypothetical protein